MKKLRFVAICLNSFGILIFVYFIFIVFIFPNRHADMGDLLGMLLFCSPFLVTLIDILLERDSSLSLYLQKKAAEERKRLAELRADNKGAKS